MATEYSCLENPMDRGAWWAIVYRVAQSWTRLKRLSALSINESRSHHDGVSLFPLGRKIKSIKIIACWRGSSSHRVVFFFSSTVVLFPFVTKTAISRFLTAQRWVTSITGF